MFQGLDCSTFSKDNKVNNLLSNANKFPTRIASPNKSRYIHSHAFLTPHFAIALYRQFVGGADAARRALNTHPPSIKAGGSV
jgi:hypothetical protein